MTTYNDLLFFGCRNHHVYPYNYRSKELYSPFEPPHFDAVSSLTILNDALISGSRDKNLRSWDLNNMGPKFSDVMGAHQDWINALETDQERTLMYSGGKEGIVKVWKVRRERLQCMAQLTGQTGSVNTLCRLDDQFGKVFASGSSDKSIRMWKLKDSTSKVCTIVPVKKRQKMLRWRT